MSDEANAERQAALVARLTRIGIDPDTSTLLRELYYKLVHAHFERILLLDQIDHYRELITSPGPEVKPGKKAPGKKLGTTVGDLLGLPTLEPVRPRDLKKELNDSFWANAHGSGLKIRPLEAGGIGTEEAMNKAVEKLDSLREQNDFYSLVEYILDELLKAIEENERHRENIEKKWNEVNRKLGDPKKRPTDDDAAGEYIPVYTVPDPYIDWLNRPRNVNPLGDPRIDQEGKGSGGVLKGHDQLDDPVPDSDTDSEGGGMRAIRSQNDALIGPMPYLFMRIWQLIH